MTIYYQQMDIAKLLREDNYHANLDFSGIDFSQENLDGHSFEDCKFSSCGFENMSLQNVSFISSSFINCRLLLNNLKYLTLNQVEFDECKLVGLNFSDSNRFGFFPVFSNSLIDNCVFYTNDLKKVSFRACRLRRTDFINCDLREARFPECQFEESVFSECRLEEADFRESSNYSIDPFNNRLKGAHFSLPEAVSFLKFLEIDLE